MWNIDKTWTLFLDRDGVINKRLEGRYVRNFEEFAFLPGVLDAIPLLNSLFGIIIIVTNQQGISKELMTENDLWKIHQEMLNEIHMQGGIIHEIYHCSELEEHDPFCRKPNPGMAFEALRDYPEISFKKSIMVGDSDSDMEFGKNLGMKTVFLQSKSINTGLQSEMIDQYAPNLLHLAKKFITL